MSTTEPLCAGGAQVKKNLMVLMGNVHSCMRQGCQEYFERYRRNVFVTPKSFLSFISGYKGMYEQKLKHTRGLAASIGAGLQKMNDAKTDVNRMKVRMMMDPKPALSSVMVPCCSTALAMVKGILHPAQADQFAAKL